MVSLRHQSLLLATLLVGAVCIPPAYAEPWPPTAAYYASQSASQPVPQPPPVAVSNVAGDPQARVGRVSLIDGTVSFHTADESAWSYATLNYPVVSGNSFWTEPGSRAEIQFGSAALRLDGGTEADLNELDDQGLRVEVTQGTVNVHVENIARGEVYQLITPRETINIMQPGTYRIAAGSETMPTEVAVLNGRAQVISSDASVTAVAGETARVAPGNPPQFTVQETVPTDFDNWSLSRDNFEEPRQITRYVSPEMTGYADLENYGQWRDDPSYGAVWVPSGVPADWEPYHYGHWAWVSPWGWTWIDDAPWGFAPFHYGRWAYINNVWCWAPGRIATRPVYAPALVAFVGGGNWGVSIGIGAQPVGWFPLGPREAYHPGYRVSENYIRNVNVPYVRDVRNITRYNSRDPHWQDHFANRRFATVVSAQDFAASRPVDHAALHVPANKLSAAPVSSVAAPPVAVHPDHRHSNDGHINDHMNMPQHAPTPPQAPLAPQVAQPHEAVPPHMNEHPANALHPEAINPMIAAPQHKAPIAEPHHEVAVPQAVAPAPGPVFQHHEPLAVQHNVPPMERQPHQPMHYVSPPPMEQQRPAPHEINIPHPTQSVPLAPTHQGWTRAPQPQPQQHAEPPHNEPHNENHDGGHSEPQHGPEPQH